MSQAIVFDVPFASTDDHRAKEDVCLDLWQRAIGYVNHVLETDEQLDIVQFRAKTHPSIEELLSAIGHADALLKLMATAEGLTHSAANALLNCSRAIGTLQCTFIAVVKQDKEEYDRCIAELNLILSGSI
ncbi:hypothetical protein [Dyella ginsengisoli]|uniref:hypothetical protein n=1 Tax=Dyella ginsengisoli TaxID=363848 RepID=UPI000376CA76|nr:hypothetical protein [Dyella ginsengisoli]